MRLKVKDAVRQALAKEDAVILEEALDRLAEQPLDAQAGWRVRQLEHCLCERPSADPTLDEP